jgi:hypothetical protein
MTAASLDRMASIMYFQFHIQLHSQSGSNVLEWESDRVLESLGSAHSLWDKGIVEKRRLQLALLGRILEKGNTPKPL